MKRTPIALALVLLLAAPAGAQTSSGECPATESRNPFASLGGAIRDAFRRAPAPPCKVDTSRELPDVVDTLVIGAGPGGGTVASRLAEGGQTVALLDAGDLSQTLPISESLAAFSASAEYRNRALAYGVERIPESGFIANYPRVGGIGGSAAGAAGIIAPFTWGAVDAMAKTMNDPTLSVKSLHGYQREVEGALWDRKGRWAEALTFGMADTLHGHTGFQKTNQPSAKTILSVLPDAPQLAPFFRRSSAPSSTARTVTRARSSRTRSTAATSRIPTCRRPRASSASRRRPTRTAAAPRLRSTSRRRTASIAIGSSSRGTRSRTRSSGRSSPTAR